MNLFSEIEDIWNADPTYGAMVIFTLPIWFPILLVVWFLSLVTGRL